MCVCAGAFKAIRLPVKARPVFSLADKIISDVTGGARKETTSLAVTVLD